MSFKLIAIRPLKGCNEKFRKNLIPNQIYKFYNEYEFLDEYDKEIRCTDDFVEVFKIVKRENNVPENFYDQGNTKINISAIVGKNGSGKSSLVELIYVAFYNLSVKTKLINDIEVDNKRNQRIRKQVKHLDDIILGLKYDLNEGSVSQLTTEEIDEKESYIEFYSLMKNEQENKIRSKIIKRDLVEDIRLNIYFVWKNEEDAEEVITISFNNDKIYLFQNKLNESVNGASIEEVTEDTSLSALFYNIIVNYSFYGLNSKEIDNWIETIFHKNDGYQTPIVLNPMRTDGNIDINTENSLTKQRFLYNLTQNSDLLQVTATNKVSQVILKLKKNDKKEFKISLGSIEVTSVVDLFEKNILKFFYNYSDNEVIIKTNDLNILLIRYILDKLIKIRETYKIYNDCNAFFDENFSTYRFSKDYDQFFGMLRDDNSHITYKLKQALNFLFFNSLKNPEFENDIYQRFLSESTGSFTIDQISCAIQNKDKLDRFCKSKKSNEGIFHLPPSIFEIDYVFENGSLFSYLSSGEKQFVYSINSILYHLTNLNSAYENETVNKYRFLNLVLDEIELYSHPEMQKQFVNSLLEGISKISVNNIQGLNILFITHSPFILSDIPKQNVLFLDDGKPRDFSRMNTFGANITDLLSDSFFIRAGFIGDLAKRKIDDTIFWLNHEIGKKQNKLEKSYNLNLKDFEYHSKIIQLIDEPVLKMKLAEMLDELYGSISLQKELAQKEINFLRKKFGL